MRLAHQFQGQRSGLEACRPNPAATLRAACCYTKSPCKSLSLNVCRLSFTHVYQCKRLNVSLVAKRYTCTLCPKKGSHLMFDRLSLITLANGPILKILSPVDSWEILCRPTYYENFHIACNVLLHYLVKFENLKMLPNFHVERDNMFN